MKGWMMGGWMKSLSSPFISKDRRSEAKEWQKNQKILVTEDKTRGLLVTQAFDHCPGLN